MEADHIKPVYEGGETHSLNLITSCFDCNRGKGKTLLSDNMTLDKQRKQMELLEERRQQIELMMEWHRSLQDIDSLKLEKITNLLNEKTTPLILSENGIQRLKKSIKNYDLLEVLEAVDCGFDYYYDQARQKFNREVKEDKDPNTWKQEGIKVFLDKFPGILRNKRKERQDPDYTFVLQIYKHNKEYCLDFYDYGFSFVSNEKNYKRLRTHNIEPEKCIALMCHKRWYDSNDMVDFINENISKILLDFPNPLR